jgi:hypothetical protein
VDVFDGRFVQLEPERGQPSPFRTIVHAGPTARALHVAFESFDPDPEGETTLIHVLESTYALSPDLLVKPFVQSNSAIDKVNVQAVGIWRFKPPFGSFQLAYLRGTSEVGEASTQGDTVFTKLSWVF